MQYKSPLWHPKHWPMWLLVFVFFFITLLPNAIVIRLGRLTGRLLYKVAKRRRHITEVNIALCYKNYSKPQQHALVKSIFEENAIGFFEAFISWLKPGKHIADVEYSGVEVLQQALAKKRGVLMVSGHYTHIDICGRLFGADYPFNALYRPQNNPVLNFVMERGRNRFLETPTINQHDMRRMLKTLKQGRILWFPFDQDHGIKSGVFAPFFGTQAATLTIPSRLKRLSHCEIVFLTHQRVSPKKYALTFQSVELTGTDFETDAKTLNRCLEQQLKIEPAQYMWVHRRFKTRPEGEASVY